MEPHPVPQDILNTEFKLFGSFTLKQFLKLLFGCLFALFIFTLDLSILVKAPLIILSVGIGIGLAIIPRFDVWVTNFTKSIFISPRYVWKQDTNAPEVLTSKATAKTDNTQKVSKKTNKVKQKIDLEEISLEKLLAARDNPRKSTPLQQPSKQAAPAVNNQQLNKAFAEIYKNPQPTLQPQQGYMQTQSIQQDVKNNSNVTMGTQPQNVSKPELNPNAENIQNSTSSTNVTNPSQVKNGQIVNRTGYSTKNSEPATQVNQTKKLNPTKQEYLNKIQELRNQLQNIVKDQHYKDKEAEIMSQINDLMQEVKLMDDYAPFQDEANMTQTVNFQGASQTQGGQVIYGIVVNKRNKPVENAEVIFEDVNDKNNEFIVETDKNGKFVSNTKIPPGNYNVSIKHPKLRFHTYSISVGESKLPAYKLRAK